MLWVLNNFVTLWRLGAQDILELPLLAASSKMETDRWLAKPDNPATSPHAPEKKKNRHPSHWYTVESRGWGGREQKPLSAPHMTLLLPATLINKHYSPKHKEFTACVSILKPLTNWLAALLVVYLVKLRKFNLIKNCCFYKLLLLMIHSLIIEDRCEHLFFIQVSLYFSNLKPRKGKQK